MSLSASWIAKIFAILQVRYGAAWTRLWGDIDIEVVAADWGQQLDGLSGEALAYALQNLPTDWPPNAAQFRSIALDRQPPFVPALPEPKADPARVAEAISKLYKPGRIDPKAWAYRLQEREKNGERLTMFQREAWRAAMVNMPKTGIGDFHPIDPSALPPGIKPSAP